MEWCENGMGKVWEWCVLKPTHFMAETKRPYFLSTAVLLTCQVGTHQSTSFHSIEAPVGPRDYIHIKYLYIIYDINIIYRFLSCPYLVPDLS